MTDIVGIGACVMDTVYSVPHFPAENSKLRAKKSISAGGGPVSTGLVTARKLGVSCAYIGNLASDSGGEFLRSDFEKYGVDTSLIGTATGFRSFTSVVLLSENTTERTCVFDKGNVPPLVLNEKQKKAVASAKILMVDGNELDSAVEASKIARESNTSVLYDCGGLYDGVEKLLKLTDIMIPSEEFALSFTGKTDAGSAAVKLFETFSPKVVVVTRGKLGGILYDGKTIKTYPIYPAEVVDSNGAGDVFHGAFAAGTVKGFGYEKCCHFASAVSAIKCMNEGARESAPDFETTKKYMKENGYEL